MRKNKNNIRYEPILFFLVIIIGFFFRLYKIETVPYGLNHDGAWAGIWAIELSQKPFPIQVFSSQPWLGESMPRYVVALIIKLFGPTIFSIRFGMTLFTLAALPCFYLLARYFFKNPVLAFFSTFLLAISGWDMIYAKSGWATSSAPLFTILTIYFLLKAVRENKIIHYILIGIFLGLSFNTYRGSPMPLTILAVFISEILSRKKKITKIIKNYIFLSIAFAIVVFPIGWYAYHNWVNYSGRMQSLYVGNRIKQVGNLSPLFENIIKAAFIFTEDGGGDDFFIKEPLLDFPTNWLFLLGIAISIVRIKSKKYLFLFFFFFASLTPALLGTPNGNHAINTIPAVYLFSGVGLLAIYDYLKSVKSISYFRLDKILVAILLFYAFTNSFNLYLGPKRRELWGFYPETTVVGKYMKPKIKTTDFYLIDNFPRDALTYLTYQGGNPWTKHYTWFEKSNSFFTVNLNNKNTSFIMYPLPQNQTIINNLKNKYPNGTFEELKYIDDNINRPAAWVYTIINL